MIAIKRPNGKTTELINADFFYAYYFIPKEILDKCGYEINQIPRVPRMIYSNRNYELIETDLFLNVIIDAYAFMVWPFMVPFVKREIYSGYEPAWRFAHAAHIWVEEFVFEGIFPSAKDFWANLPTEHFGYVSFEEASYHLRHIVPLVMERYKIKEVIAVAREHPCHEDFDYRGSWQKTDFFRRWNHSRTRFKQISYEDYIRGLRNDKEWCNDIVDVEADFEEKVYSKVKVEEFVAKLKPKDLEILNYRLQGKTYEEIAIAMGYANHSGIAKKIKSLKKQWEDFEKNYL